MEWLLLVTALNGSSSTATILPSRELCEIAVEKVEKVRKCFDGKGGYYCHNDKQYTEECVEVQKTKQL
jgi:hypothetical protein